MLGAKSREWPAPEASRVKPVQIPESMVRVLFPLPTGLVMAGWRLALVPAAQDHWMFEEHSGWGLRTIFSAAGASCPSIGGQRVSLPAQ